MIGIDQDLRTLAIDLFDALRRLSSDGAGISRMTYGPGETRAMRLVADRATAGGIAAQYDAAANLVLTLPGQYPEQPCVVCGSHLDSVPDGGNYDGAAGVIAGLLAVLHLKRRGVIPPRTIKVYAFRGEESAWFGKCYLGSRALFGRFEADDLTLPQRDSGKPLEYYMRQAGADVGRLCGGEVLLPARQVACYLELHIEQGPVMVERGVPLGIVTGIRGNHRYLRAVCRGEAAHSGTVPRWLRHDAVFAVAEFITRLDRHWQALLEQGQDSVVTVGIIGTNPAEHAMSRVPGEVTFCLEYRSQSSELLEEFKQVVHDEAAMIGRMRGVTFELGALVPASPAVMDARLIEHLAALGTEAGIAYERLPSGAGHDAAVFANEGVPTGMIFVRNAHGSHNPREAMDYDDFFLGAELLLGGLMTAPQVLP